MYFVARERETKLLEEVSRLSKKNLELELHIAALESNAAKDAAQEEDGLESCAADTESDTLVSLFHTSFPLKSGSDLVHQIWTESASQVEPNHCFEDVSDSYGDDCETSCSSDVDPMETDSGYGSVTSTGLIDGSSDWATDAPDSAWGLADGEWEVVPAVSGEAWAPDTASSEEWEAEQRAAAAVAPKLYMKFGDAQSSALVESTCLYDSFASSPAAVVYRSTDCNRSALSATREEVQKCIWDFFEERNSQLRKQLWDHFCAIRLERGELTAWFESLGEELSRDDVVFDAVEVRNTLSHLGAGEETVKVDQCMIFAQGVCIRLGSEKYALAIRELRDAYQEGARMAFEELETLKPWGEGPVPEVLSQWHMENTLSNASTPGTAGKAVADSHPAFGDIAAYWSQCFENVGGTRRQAFAVV